MDIPYNWEPESEVEGWGHQLEKRYGRELESGWEPESGIKIRRPGSEIDIQRNRKAKSDGDRFKG